MVSRESLFIYLFILLPFGQNLRKLNLPVFDRI